MALIIVSITIFATLSIISGIILVVVTFNWHIFPGGKNCFGIYDAYCSTSFVSSSITKKIQTKKIKRFFHLFYLFFLV